MRADASAKFSSGSRWGYFPSVSLGWRLTEEGFMKDHSSLDDLKFRLSYGSSGNDNIGNFQYLAGYELGSNYIIGGGVQKGITSKGVANPDLTWEKIKIYNGGIDFSLLQRRLYGSADVFYRERNGMLATRAVSLPSTFGARLPLENLNSQNNRGFELNVGTAGKLNDLKYDVSFNLSWSRSKWSHYEEPVYTDPDQIRLYTVSGRWTDYTFGYVSDGLFTSQEEINSLGFDQDLQGNKTLKPGDIKYKDVNGDKKLDWRDQVEIGKGTYPHWMTGTNINLDYKNFDFSALFQGAFGYYTNVQLPWLSETYYQLRWTSQNNNPNALIPRLGGAATNYLFSTHSYKKAGYLRLKNASLGYNISGSLLQKINVSKVRLYVAGTNMLTFDKLKKYDIDPEAPSGNGGLYYPQQRTFSLGAIISL
jgi:TonB-linked SusC/RagA family outer membrane protein